MAEPKTNRGGGPPSILLMKASDLLNDYGWHELEPVLIEMGKLIPSSEASRWNEKERKSSGGPLERQKSKSLEARIWSGRRDQARTVLTNKSLFKIVEKDGVYLVRMHKLSEKVRVERSKYRAFHTVTPERVADELLLPEIDAKSLLGELTYDQLLAAAVVLAERQQAVSSRQMGPRRKAPDVFSAYEGQVQRERGEPDGDRE